MLVFIVFGCFLPLMAIEDVTLNVTTVSSEVKNTSSTQEQPSETQSDIFDQTSTVSVIVGPDTVQPGTQALEVSTPMMTTEMASATETTGATNYETSYVETSTFKGSGSSTSTIGGIKTTTSTVFTSTTPWFFTSTQTNQVKEETTSFVLASEKPTTNVFFTARQSHATQTITPTIQETRSTARAFLKTNVASTKKPIVRRERKKELDGNKKGAKHGKIVAGIIGGALIVMMIGFLAILYKKHKLKKQQIATNDWAGPTPFLDGRADNGQVTLRSTNRISLNSFLPQRFSKRLSLLPETGEEMEVVTTFAVKQENNKEETEKPAKEMNGNSENSTKTEDTVLIDETEKNGQAQTSEKEIGQNQTAQPATVEDPPKESENEQGLGGNDGSDSAV